MENILAMLAVFTIMSGNISPTIKAENIEKKKFEEQQRQLEIEKYIFIHEKIHEFFLENNIQVKEKEYLEDDL